METSLNVTDNIVESLELECVKAGTSLNKVCKAVGVSRGVLSRWKTEEPKSIKTLRIIQDEIRKQAEKKAQVRA
ncbi:MAG: hypothetical protein ACK505_06100 [Flavobacteriales bacterium]